nr:uncharacterized protein LOC123853504 [Mirounga angustirostris]
MQLGGTDVLRALGGRGAGGSGGEPKRGVQGRWNTRAGTPTHTGHMHLHVRPSVHAYVARTHTSLSQPCVSARAHTHTHTHYTPSHVQSPSVPTCRWAHADAPAANMHRVCSPPRTHVWKVTPVHTHASLHTRAGGPGPAHIHTTGCSHLHTNASQPGNVQEPKGEKDVSPTGRYMGRWGVGPTAPSVCPSWTDTSSSPHKGTFDSGQRRWGTHSGHRAGGGGQAKSSKQRVMEWREEGAPLPPPLPIRGSLYSQIKPNHFTGPRKPGRCAHPPASLPRQNSGQGEGAVVFFFFFSFLNIYIYLYYVYYIYIICKYIFKTI